MSRDHFVQVLEKANEERAKLLQEKSAVDIVAGDNFVAYIKERGGNHFEAEVWSWGRQQEPISADSAENLRSKLFETFTM